ncbi:MAG: MarR family transcriptional regulator [Chloroflexi bacterium]|nr:MarR family transcriptional regulator [Chloroflexota bacterium]
MKPLQAECAARVVEIVPFVLRHLRAHIRSQRDRKFTIPQFRVLAYLYLNGQATLSELATSQGVSLPTMSKLVGSLVQRKLVAREGHEQDRRKLRLQLTREGVKAHDAQLESTRQYVAEKLARLRDDEVHTIISALDSLQSVFQKRESAEG